MVVGLHTFDYILKTMQYTEQLLVLFALDVKWPRRDLDPLRPSSAKTENEWSYAFIPPICIHDMNRDNFVFFSLYHQSCCV
jgi:hypothetical protein